MDFAVALAAAASSNGRSRLIIDRALKRDDGTYMCVAENPAGLRRAIAAVRVTGQTTNMAFLLQCVTVNSVFVGIFYGVV